MYQQKLSQALNYAADGGLLGANPIARVKSETVDNRKVRALTMDQFVEIIRAAERGEARDLLLVAGLTGLRPSNVRLLRHDEIEDSVVRIPPEKSKNSRWTVVPLSSLVQQVLDEKCGNGSALVFPARGTSEKAKSVRNLRRTFKAACERAGMEWNVALYDLRHFFASQLAKQGANEQQIGRLLCHVGQSVSSRYVHQDIEDLRHFVDELADRYLEASGAPSASQHGEQQDEERVTV
jgi:integrase